MSPTPLAAWLIALAAVSALVIPPPLAALLAVSVLAASIVDAWMARSLPELDRRFPRNLARGVPADFTVRAVNRSARLTIRQATPADLSLDPQESNDVLDARLVAHRRGRHKLPALATRSIGPLRLGSWYHRTGDVAEVIVYPDLPAARRLAIAVRQGRFQEEGRRSRGPLGLGTDLERIREYLPDDDIRQVNWRATARRETPMSNQWRVEQDREVICLIDSGRLMAAPVGDRTRLDAAIDAVAAIAAVADEVGDRVGVVAFAGTILRRLSPRRSGGEAVVGAVFDLEPTNQESDYALAFQVVASAKRSLVFIFTDIVEEAAARPLTEAMSVLGRHHAVVVASVIDDDLHGQVNTPAESVADVYRTAAALTVLEDRARVVTLLSHVGAEVVEAPLNSLSARCVGAYLRARSRARV